MRIQLLRLLHEVNNLLTPVVGLADLLEHTGCDDELRDQLVKQAVDRCQRAVAICDLLVNLAKTAVPGEQSDIAVALGMQFVLLINGLKRPESGSRTAFKTLDVRLCPR